MAKKLDVKLKGFSSLPAVNAHLAGKGGTAGKLLDEALQAIEKKKLALGPKHQDKLAGWIAAEEKALDVERRRLLALKGERVFGLIVGQSWFQEVSTMGECTTFLNLKAHGHSFGNVACSAALYEIKVDLLWT